MTIRRPWVVGVTGASGTPYAASFIRGLLEAGESVDLIVSQAARLTILDEERLAFRDAHWRTDLESWIGPHQGDIEYWSARDFAAGPSSGSYLTQGMGIIPASAACVSGVALGLSKDLIQRAAAVTLKERRPLLLMVRESPYTRSLLKRMTELVDEGATIMPASPAFYGKPDSIQELVDFVAGRALDVLGIDTNYRGRWTGLDLGQVPDPS